MAISTLFFIFLIAFVIGGILAAINMGNMARNMSRDFHSDPFGSFGKASNGFFNHMIIGVITAMCGLGMTITGIIWIVQYIKAG